MLGNQDIHHKRKAKVGPLSLHKNQFEWIKDLNVRQNLKLLDEVTGETLPDTDTDDDFLIGHGQLGSKSKMDKGDCRKLRSV